MPSGLQVRSVTTLEGKLAGLVTLVNVPPDREYMVMYGEVSCPTARKSSAGEKATENALPVGSVAGLLCLL